MARLDPHSYADADQPSIVTARLDLTVDFSQRILSGTAELELDRAPDGDLDLDTRGLHVEAVEAPDGAALAFELHPEAGFMGARLTVRGAQDRLRIRYRTSPEASALQWLEPAQTDGGVHPYVFTQCQAIHARSVMPCQDTPRVRQQMHVTLRVPAALTAVVAAAHEGREVEGEQAVFRYFMPQRIPSYLFAFAVGDLASKPIGARSAVWAEPGMLEAAAWEFEGVDGMLTAAEALFGAYPWERFDLLLMPPSFPYGGMENPRLTFLTPTLLAQDRSLVSVVAHELAHSWTGNLVTNASIEDFWLNEGFTVYAERRILEALEGAEAMALHAALGRKHLEVDVARLEAQDPALTQLDVDLTGKDPDDVYSSVPYEKGYLFLRRIEQAVGQAAFDRFLATYIERFAFTSITTKDFEAFLQQSLPAALEAVDVEAWLRAPGIPEDAPRADSERLTALSDLAATLGRGDRPDEATLAALDANGWQVLLSLLPDAIPEAVCEWLDQRFELSAQKNYEILVSWLTCAVRSGYDPVWPVVKDTLQTVGRGKYLRPLYTALVGRGEAGRAFAREIFEGARAGYHPVAQQLVSGVLGA